MANYCCGNEFRVNENGAFYPGYARLEDLREIGLEVMKLLVSPSEPSEVKIIRTHNDLGLHWQFSLYSWEATEKKAYLSRVYSFDLYPSWGVKGFHDHWLSGHTPRTEHMVKSECRIQEIVNRQLAKMKENYKAPEFTPLLDKYFKCGFGAIILYTSIKGITKQPLKVTRWSGIAKKDAMSARARSIRKSRKDH